MEHLILYPKSIAVIGNHLPRLCGIATFTTDLCNALATELPNPENVIALAMDDKKIPETLDKRMEVIDKVFEATHAAGVPDDKVYIDPLAMTIATKNQSSVIACDTICAAHEKYPKAHFTMGLSNISFGLPVRKQVNRAFLTLAMQAGLDSAILDPLDKELRAAIVTTEMLLGKDKHCMNYLKASRAGLFE